MYNSAPAAMPVRRITSMNIIPVHSVRYTMESSPPHLTTQPRRRVNVCSQNQREGVSPTKNRITRRVWKSGAPEKFLLPKRAILRQLISGQRYREPKVEPESICYQVLAHSTITVFVYGVLFLKTQARLSNEMIG
jgi:hypothetical protein